MKKVYELTDDEINTIGAGLECLAFKIASPLLANLRVQWNKQTVPAEKIEPSETPNANTEQAAPTVQ